MATAGSIRAGRAFVELGVDDTITAGLNKAQRKLNAFGVGVRNIGLGITTAFGGAAASIGALMIPLARWSDAYQEILNRIMASNDEAAQSTSVLMAVTEELFAIASRARAPVKGLTELYGRLSLSAKEAGLNQQRLLKTTETISKAAVVGGGTQESIDAALIQLSQIFGAGGQARGIGQELRSLREQAPFLFKMMAQGLGRIGVTAKGTTTEMERMATAGEISSRDIAQAILAMGDEVETRFARIAPTVSQSLTVLSNATIKAFGEMSDKTGLGRGIATLIQAVAGEIGNFVKAITPMVGEIVEWGKANEGLIITLAKVVAGAIAFGAVVTGLGLGIQAIAFSIKGLATGVTAVFGIGKAFGFLGKLLLKIPGAAFPVKTALWGISSAGMLAKGSVVGLGAALKGLFLLLATNPYVLIAAGAIAAAVAIKKLTDNTVELANAQGEALKRGDEQRTQTDLHMTRLEQLAQTQRLTSGEMREADQIIRDLAKLYGNLGISLDKTTGKLLGFEAAQAKVNGAMIQAEKSQLAARIAETHRNLAALSDQRTKGIGLIDFDNPGDADRRMARWVNKNGREISQLRAQLLEDQTRLNSLNAPVAAPVDSGEVVKVESASEIKAREKATEEAKRAIEDAIKDGIRAREELAEVEERERAKGRTRLQQELADIKKVYDERVKLLKLIEAGEMAREGGPRQFVLYEIGLALSNANANARGSSIEAQQRDDQQSALDWAQAIQEDNRARLEGREERLRGGAELMNNLERERLQMAMEAARSDDERLRIAREMAELESKDFRNESLERANELFGDDPEKLKEAEETINAVADRMAAMPDILAEAADSLTPSRGTFNPFEVRDLGGNELDRIQDNTKKTADNTKDISTAMSRLAFT